MLETIVLPNIFLVHIDCDPFFLLELFMSSIGPLKSRYDDMVEAYYLTVGDCVSVHSSFELFCDVDALNVSLAAIEYVHLERVIGICAN